MLLISVWGDPSGWKETQYCVELPNGSIKKIDGTYKSTLAPVLEAFQSPNCLLLASSTLGELPTDCYESVVRSARNYIDKFLRKPEYCKDASKITVEILPGIGRFRDEQKEKWFEGTIDAFRLAAYLTVYTHLFQLKPEVIVLDLSHGVNYMPVYTRLAVEDAINAYISSPDFEVDRNLELIVLNSEPVVIRSGGTNQSREPQRSLIGIVERIKIGKDRAREALYSRITQMVQGGNIVSVRLLPGASHSEELKNKASNLRRQWDSRYKQVHEFSSAARQGLILLLAEFAEQLARLEDTELQDELSRLAYLANSEDLVQIDANKLRYLIIPDPVGGLILAIVKLAKELAKVIEDRYDGGFNLDGLCKIADTALPKPSKIIVCHELGQLRDRVELARRLCQDTKRWILYDAYIRFCEQRVNDEPLLELFRSKREHFVQQVEKVCSRLEPLAENSTTRRSGLDWRNLLAHGGLERNVTMIYDNTKQIFIKYDSQRKNEILKMFRRNK